MKKHEQSEQIPLDFDPDKQNEIKLDLDPSDPEYFKILAERTERDKEDGGEYYNRGK